MHIILTRSFLVLLLIAASALLTTVTMHSGVPRPSGEIPAALAVQEAAPRAGDLVLARKSSSAAHAAQVADELAAANAQASEPAPVTPATTDLREVAHQAAVTAGIDPRIFVRQIQAESKFDPAARSGAGAIGIAQIVPRFHPDVDPTDPHASLRYAATLMAAHLANYGGDYAKALAAYNAGPTAVARHGGVPPFAETQNYVSKILGGQ
jgi:soluble lytic murein transglycosylase-like protein